MNRITAGAALALLLGSMLVPAQAQEREQGTVHIPESSIERDSDVGVQAHTSHRRLLAPSGGLGEKGGMSPAQMRAFYNLPATVDAKGIATGGKGIIAIVDAYDYPTALNDFNVFSSRYFLPLETGDNSVFQVVYQGVTRPPGNVGWAQEAALDIEWAHAMAPGAKIILVEAQSSNFADLMAAVDLARSLGASQISMSWGSSEFSTEKNYDVWFRDLQTGNNPLFFASSGDQGGRTSYPAVSPLVVAVGGTSVTTTSAGVFLSEQGWKDGGGGPSAYEGKPAWQSGVENTGSKRSTPDLSSNADPYTGVSVYGPVGDGTFGWMVFGGTSVSAPCMAGMVNLSDVTYSSTTTFLMAVYSGRQSANFRDITVGKNKRYYCKVGWDFVTGVGSPQGTGF